MCDADLLTCLKAAKRAKACGSDEVPAEVFLDCSEAREDLFTLVKLCWSSEIVPADITEGVFIPIWKRKGSSDDFSKYRFICLLNSCYKILSSYLLLQLVKESESYLPESQAGFRKGRGCIETTFISCHS